MSLKKNNKIITSEALDLVLQSLLGDYRKYSIKLAYSGGLDSQVLLHLLAQLKLDQHFDLQAIHVHHGAHKNSDDWAQFCSLSCKALDIPLEIEKVEVNKKGFGFEAAAREVRYGSLSAHISTSSDVLLTAHHLNDQAETLLLHLVRGAGITGLAAMPLKRKIGRGQLCRPLLDVNRAHILEYAKSNGLSWIEDDSNSDPDVRRSFLRQQIFPKLNDHWPGVSTTLARTASHMAEADNLLGYLAESDLVGRVNPLNDCLLVSMLAELPAERLRNVIRYKFQSLGMRAPSTRQMAELVRHIFSPPKTGHATMKWGKQCVQLYRNEIWLGVETDLNEVAGELVWNLDARQGIQFGNNYLSVVESRGQGLAKRHTGSTVTVRCRQGGERCRLPGRKHHTTLKNLLQQEGVPPWQRKTLPLIYVGDQLAAVGDRWVCEPFVANANEPGWLLKVSFIPQN